MSSKVLYAQVREDPEVDRQALAITAEDRVLTITSGGCTALTLLAEGPRELVSVDVNPAQNYLLELKLCAIQALPLIECRRFLGARTGRGRWIVYQKLAEGLSPQARTFWDQRRPLVERGVLSAGTTERMVRWFRLLLLGLVHPPARLRQLFRQPDVVSQTAFYHDIWNSKRWQRMLRVAFHPWVFRLMYGRAFSQRWNAVMSDDQLRETAPGGAIGKGATRLPEDLSSAWIRKIERAFTGLPIQSNYFLSQLLWGRYLPGEQGLPPYLRRGMFERVRAYADRLRWVTSELSVYLADGPSGAFTKMTLSNALEWLPGERIVSAFAAVAHALRVGGRCVLRHLLAVTPLPAGVLLQEQRSLSDQLTREERAFLYTRVSLYERTSV